MGVEIERKFLINREKLDNHYEGERIAQGYFDPDAVPTTRVRIRGDKGYLTVKGRNEGISRPEFEYEIPLGDAEYMIEKFCSKTLVKDRFLIQHGEHTWEVDVFRGENEGLFIAELELQTENETFIKPDWLGEEVSNDTRYYNSNLINLPYSKWKNT